MTKIVLLILASVLIQLVSSYILVPPPRRPPNQNQKRFAELVYGSPTDDEWPYDTSLNFQERSAAEPQVIFVEMPSADDGDSDADDEPVMIKRQRPITRFG